MKKLLLGAFLLVLAMGAPIPAMAEVNISIGISLPPPIMFPAPPEVIVLPETNYVYVAPDVGVDIFFWGGWWWRPWEGRWYRSYYYDRGWAYYNSVPRFYYDIDPGWRGYYRGHNWYGHRWNYERIPNQRLQKNWKSWKNDRYWERERNWGVQGYKPRPQQQQQELRNRRQQEYRQRPEVQRHREWQEQQRQSQAQRPHGQQRPPQVQREEMGRGRPHDGAAPRGETRQGQPENKRKANGNEERREMDEGRPGR